MKVTRFGPSAVLIGVEDSAEALALARRLRELRESGALRADEIVPGADSVLVDGLRGEIPRLQLDVEAEDSSGDLVQIRVVWGGPDLAWAAEQWQCSQTEATARMESIEFVAAFCGFAPGFAYLAGLPSDWALPRLPNPRTRVAAGAVAIGGSWCGIYPRSSPGGWRLLGRTEAVLWDTARPDPAAITPGTRVRFVS